MQLGFSGGHEPELSCPSPAPSVPGLTQGNPRVSPGGTAPHQSCHLHRAPLTTSSTSQCSSAETSSTAQARGGLAQGAWAAEGLRLWQASGSWRRIAPGHSRLPAASCFVLASSPLRGEQVYLTVLC